MESSKIDHADWQMRVEAAKLAIQYIDSSVKTWLPHETYPEGFVNTYEAMLRTITGEKTAAAAFGIQPEK